MAERIGLHPLDLMRKHGWSYCETALKFGVSEFEVRRWGFSKKSTNYRNPPPMAFLLAELLDSSANKDKN